METPDPPNDTPGALKQVVLTPHDIPLSLRVDLMQIQSNGTDVLYNYTDSPPRCKKKKHLRIRVAMGF